MILFVLLLFIYGSFFLFMFLLWFTRKRRNYWRRLLCDIHPTPLQRQLFRPISTFDFPNDSPDLIVSYSLYGNYSKYLRNLQRNLLRIRQYRPSWRPYVYLSSNIPLDIRKDLHSFGAKVIVMSPLPSGHEAALWRFLPASQSIPFVSLDADDLFTLNFVHDIESWLHSRRKFVSLDRFKFILPLTAGTWGSRDSAIPDIQERLDKYSDSWFGFDEAFLYHEIWPEVKKCGYWSTSFFSPIRLICLGLFLCFLLLLFVSLYFAWRIHTTRTL